MRRRQAGLPPDVAAMRVCEGTFAPGMWLCVDVCMCVFMHVHQGFYSPSAPVSVSPAGGCVCVCMCVSVHACSPRVL